MTSLGKGQRIKKNDLRVTAFGTIDELNSAIGLAMAYGLAQKLQSMLGRVQTDLFTLSTDICFLVEEHNKSHLSSIEDTHISGLEKLIDNLAEEITPLTSFILPGGSLGAAGLHLTRTICRRAEREVLSLMEVEPVNPLVLTYLNRLSDLLFAMARYENSQKGIDDIPWSTKD